MSPSLLTFLDNDVHLYAYCIGCVWTHAFIHRALETDLYRHPHPAVMLKLMAVVLTHCQTEEGPIAEERGGGCEEKMVVGQRVVKDSHSLSGADAAAVYHFPFSTHTYTQMWSYSIISPRSVKKKCKKSIVVAVS